MSPENEAMLACLKQFVGDLEALDAEKDEQGINPELFTEGILIRPDSSHGALDRASRDYIEEFGWHGEDAGTLWLTWRAVWLNMRPGRPLCSRYRAGTASLKPGSRAARHALQIGPLLAPGGRH